MVFAVLVSEHFPNIWCRNDHRMCPPFFVRATHFRWASFAENKVLRKELQKYQKLTHRKPHVSLRENGCFYAAFLDKTGPSTPGGSVLCFWGYKYGAEITSRKLIKNGRIVAAREGGLQKQSLVLSQFGY